MLIKFCLQNEIRKKNSHRFKSYKKMGKKILFGFYVIDNCFISGTQVIVA